MVCVTPGLLLRVVPKKNCCVWVKTYYLLPWCLQWERPLARHVSPPFKFTRVFSISADLISTHLQ